MFTQIRLFKGFEKIVQMLIEKGAHVNAVNEDGNSALIFAVLEGNISNIFVYTTYEICDRN